MTLFKNSQGDWDWGKIGVAIIGVLLSATITLATMLHADQNDNIRRIDNCKADSKTVNAKIQALDARVTKKIDSDVIKQMILLQQQKLEQQKKESDRNYEIQQQQLADQKVIDKEMIKELKNLNTAIIKLEQKIE